MDTKDYLKPGQCFRHYKQNEDDGCYALAFVDEKYCYYYNPSFDYPDYYWKRLTKEFCGRTKTNALKFTPLLGVTETNLKTFVYSRCYYTSEIEVIFNPSIVHIWKAWVSTS